MNYLKYSGFICLIIFAGYTTTHSQVPEPVMLYADKTDTVKNPVDTISKTTNAHTVSAPAISKKEKKKGKRKKDKEGDNPYLVNKASATPIPYNSPQEKPKTPADPVVGEILKEIIKEKKRN